MVTPIHTENEGLSPKSLKQLEEIEMKIIPQSLMRLGFI